MKPTPAQIEAVIDEFKDELTSGQRRLIVNEICRLTATAEVAEQSEFRKEYTIGYQHGFAGCKKLVADAIERCAQVVRDLYPFDDRYDEVVDAIYALKDKP